MNKDSEKRQSAYRKEGNNMEAIKITKKMQCTKRVDKEKRDKLYSILTNKNKDIYTKLAK